MGRGDMSCGAMDGTKNEIRATRIGQKSEIERTKNKDESHGDRVEESMQMRRRQF